MSDIIKRLEASIRYDVISGSNHERAVLASQIVEAIKELKYLHAQLSTALADKERLEKEWQVMYAGRECPNCGYHVTMNVEARTALGEKEEG